jgi:tetratricopeptide (TPR) repeat protein
MNTQKLLNKFRGWALHEPVIKREIPYAEDEFFAFHTKPTLDDDPTLQGLFIEWFLFDRKTTSHLKTPIDLFIEKKKNDFSKDETVFLESLKRTIFGIFEVLSTKPNEGLIKMKQVDDPMEWTVQDFSGSKSLAPKTILFTRLASSSPYAIMTGWAAGYPMHNVEIKKDLTKIIEQGKKLPITPRDLLRLFAERIQWEDKGMDFCRNKLASIWQKWSPKGMTWKELEEGFGRGDQECLHKAHQALIESLPHKSLMDDAVRLIQAYWNTFSGATVGKKTPLENVQELPKGPKEKLYYKRLSDESIHHFQEKGKIFTPEEVQAWLKDPAKGENGVSPFDLIYDERIAAGHPEPDKIGLHITINATSLDSPELKQASSDYNRANDEMVKKNYAVAVKLYESAYRLIQYDTKFAFRLLGNLGLCYALLGQREKAMETLQAALRHNPDYDLARKRLSELEKMTPEEYLKFLKEAPNQVFSTPWEKESRGPEDAVQTINRHAITIKWKQPFVDWANGLEEGGPKLRVDDQKNTGTVYLVPETNFEKDFPKNIKGYFSFIFEQELLSWSEDEKTWPRNRTYKIFQDWFVIIYSDLILDLTDDVLESEDF